MIWSKTEWNSLYNRVHNIIYLTLIAITILATLSAFLQEWNSTAVARIALAVPGTARPIFSLFRQSKATKEKYKNNCYLHSEILVGNWKILTYFCFYVQYHNMGNFVFYVFSNLQYLEDLFEWHKCLQETLLTWGILFIRLWLIKYKMEDQDQLPWSSGTLHKVLWKAPQDQISWLYWLLWNDKLLNWIECCTLWTRSICVSAYKLTS